jgi:LPS sulfotransferase NodH
MPTEDVELGCKNMYEKNLDFELEMLERLIRDRSRILSALRLSFEEVRDEAFRLSKYFSDLFEPVPSSDHYDGHPRIVLATTSRVGGHFLGQLLAATGSGSPLEYFAPYEIEKRLANDFAESGRIKLQEYWRELFSEASSKHVPITVKCNASTVALMLILRVWPHGPQSWKWVYLYRHSIIDQAISLVLAEMTGRWNSFEPGDDVAAGDVDLDVVQDRIQVILNERMRWDTIFTLVGVTPLRIGFEEVEYDALECVGRVRKFVGLRNEWMKFSDFVPLQRQRTCLNEEIKSRFLRKSKAAF